MRQHVILTLLLGLTLAAGDVSGAAAGGKDFAAGVGLYEEALGRYESGDYGTAVIDLKKLLLEQPDYLPARVLLGRAQLRAGNAAAAVKELLLARGKGADERLVQLPLAQAYMLWGHYEDALVEARREAVDENEAPVLLATAGDALLRLGRLEEAEQTYAKASRMDPSEPTPRVGLARVNIAKGKLVAAAWEAEKAVTLAPRDSQARFVLAEIWRYQGDYARAQEAYDRVLEIDPDHLQARLGRAAVRFHAGDNAGALDDVRHVEAKVTDQPQAQYIEALVLARGDERERAREVLEAVTRRLTQLQADAPEDVRSEARLLAGAANFALGNLQQARENLRAFTGQHPRHVAALKLLGAVAAAQGDLTRAVLVLDQALELAPSDVRLRELLGRTLIRAGDPGRAERILEHALTLAPEDPAVRVALGRARLALGKRGPVLKDLEQSVSLETGSVAELFMLGVEYLHAGRREDARRVTDALLRRAPGNPTSHNMAGLAALADEDARAARAHFQRALELDPEHLPATNNLALLDVREGHPDAARARYLAFLERNPRNGYAMRELGRILAGAGNYKEAARWLRKAREVDANDMETQLLLVDVALKSGELDEALDVGLMAERKQPSNVAVLMALARVHLARKARDDATKVLARAAELAHDSGPRSFAVATLQIEAGDVDGARASLDRAVKQAPDLIAAHARLVALEVEQGRLGEALERARTARRWNASAAAPAMMEGDVLMRMGHPGEALEAYSAAAQHGDMSSTLAVRLFNAKRRSGQGRPAAEELERWLAAHPDDQHARRALATYYMEVGEIAPAIAHHQKLVADLPDDPLVNNNLAWLYQLAGDGRALEQAERAYKLAPEQSGVLDTIGWILVQRDQADRGVFYLREAQSRATRDPLVQYHLAVGLERLGLVDEARRELERLLDSGVTFDGIDEARSMLARLPKQ